ncbi:MAG: ABC transporter ATP-binding protein [Alphaproteobacteria bacterium]|nr:ABC transporter ATP-binding protein [Alphaproteobacteria bacterium]
MLFVRGLTLRVAGRVLLEDASFDIGAREKVALVGRNGTGKSTLLRAIMGEVQSDAGSIDRARNARVGWVAQEPAGDARSPLAVVLGADTERTDLLAAAESATEAHAIAEIHARLADIGAHAAPARAATILAGLGFSSAVQAAALATLSGGWRMRVALAGALFARPDLLLLDEPTNHLDLEASLWLEGYLERYPAALLLVSHDRNLLNTIARRVLHLEERRIFAYTGNYDTFERIRRERLAQQAKAAESQAADRRRIQAFVDRFRYQATKARQAQSRLKALARMEPIPVAPSETPVRFEFPVPEALPPPILSVDDGAVGYLPGHPVLRRLTLRLDQSDRIALLGANGNGKSTLARLLAGRLALQSGRMSRSPKLRIGYFAQHQLDVLVPGDTAYQHLARLMPRHADAAVRGRLGGFGFSQAMADVPARDLSGGEKARLLFALISFDAPHVLILDEPTNHLDITSREALVQALADYQGAVILISHDPHLIALTAERLWLVAEGTVALYDGDLDDYRRLVLEQVRGNSSEPGARKERKAGTSDARERRQAGARLRAETAPIRQRIHAAEAAIERLSTEQATIERELASPAVYAGAPDALAHRNKRRAEIARQIAASEAQWLSAQAELEAIAGTVAGDEMAPERG